MSNNIIDGITRTAAQQAIREGTIWNFMLYWDRAPEGQREHAKRILREELAR